LTLFKELPNGVSPSGSCSLNKRIHQLPVFLVFTAILSLLISCQSDKPEDQTVIAVADRYLSLNEFRTAYELDPSFPSYKTGLEGLIEFADIQVDKLLSARMAEKDGLFEHSPYHELLAYKEQTATIRAYYSDLIHDRLQVTKQEIISAFKKMSARIHLKHLFTEREQEAWELRQNLSNGVPFDTLARQIFTGYDRQSGRPANLGWINWGELEPSLENAAFTLEPGLVSEPIKSRWGYHILVVTEREELFVPSEDRLLQMSDLISKKVKQKKEEVLAGEYLKELLDPLDIKVKREAFSKIALHLGFDREAQNKFQPKYMARINDDDIARMEQYLKTEQDDLFMTSKQEDWSIREFLDKLKGIPFSKRPGIVSKSQLQADIGLMIRNEFLYIFAREKGFHKTNYVDSVSSQSICEIAYQHYLQESYENIAIPDQVKAYFATPSSNRIIPPNQEDMIFPEMQSIDSFNLYYATRKLHEHLLKAFPDVKITVNTRLLSEESKRIDWNNPIRMFVPDNF